MAQSRMGHRKNGLSVATVVLLAMGAGHQAGAGETLLGERLGEWGNTWKANGVRNELRIDEATPKAVTGTFCGVRKGDGSVFFFDFGTVKSKVKAESVELKRGKHTYWIAATDDGLELKYQRKGKKRHQMAIEQGTMQCIDQITPAAARIEQDEPAGAGADMVGAWTAYDKKGRATEVRISSHSAESTSGTVCYVRKDGSVAYFDFGPEGPINADIEDGRVEIERTPFKKKMRHVMEMTGDGHLSYKESVGNRSPRLTLEMNRGTAEDGCMRRIRPGHS